MSERPSERLAADPDKERSEELTAPRAWLIVPRACEMAELPPRAIRRESSLVIERDHSSFASRKLRGGDTRR